MKEKKVVREERNKEKLTSGDWVMAEFYSIHSLKSSRMPVSYTHLTLPTT